MVFLYFWPHRDTDSIGFLCCLFHFLPYIHLKQTPADFFIPSGFSTFWGEYLVPFHSNSQDFFLSVCLSVCFWFYDCLIWCFIIRVFKIFYFCIKTCVKFMHSGYFGPMLFFKLCLFQVSILSIVSSISQGIVVF